MSQCTIVLLCQLRVAWGENSSEKSLGRKFVRFLGALKLLRRLQFIASLFPSASKCEERYRISYIKEIVFAWNIQFSMKCDRGEWDTSANNIADGQRDYFVRGENWILTEPQPVWIPWSLSLLRGLLGATRVKDPFSRNSSLIHPNPCPGKILLEQQITRWRYSDAILLRDDSKAQLVITLYVWRFLNATR